MAETPDDEPVEVGAEPSDGIERRTLSEVVQANYEALQLERAEEERATRRKVREEERQQAQKHRLTRARAAKSERVQAFSKAQSDTRSHVAAASTSLRRALSSAMGVSLPRHSAEARLQNQLVRSLEEAISALRRAGRGSSAAINTELDLDTDLDLEAG